MRPAITIMNEDNEDVTIVWAVVQCIEEVSDLMVRIKTKEHEYFAPISQVKRIAFSMVRDNDRSVWYPLHMIEAVRDYTGYLKDGNIIELGDKDLDEWFQSVTK